MEKENQELQKCTFYPNLDKNFSQSERKVTKKDIDKFYGI
jgi:hypothetical protein